MITREELSSSLREYLDNVDSQLEDNTNLIKNGFVNIKEYDHLVIGDDYTNAIQTALNDNKCVFLPNGTYNVSDTIVLNRYMSLIGENGLSDLNSTIINYTGPYDYKKTVFQMGGNEVGDEPSIDASSIKIKNITINCNQNIGFGIYSTYFTNESTIENIKVKGAVSHCIYVAKGWYGFIKNIIVQDSLGCGITLGIPLKFPDGSTVNWTAPASLELNNVFIEKIRAIRCGQDKLFNFDSNSCWGYGIGCGEGNGFNLDGFLSESCDGAGLYCRIGSQPTHKVQKGYLEANCVAAVTEGRSSKACTVIYETTSTNARNINLENIFIASSHEQGIAQKSENYVEISLTNISYGAFTQFETAKDPFIRHRCHYGLGYNNDVTNSFVFPVWYEDANIRYSINKIIPPFLPDSKTTYRLYMIPTVDITLTSGGVTLLDVNNEVVLTCYYPKTTLKANEMVLLSSSSKIANSVKMVEAGNPPTSTDTNVKFVLMVSPRVF